MEPDEFVEALYGRLLRTAVLLTGDRRAAEDLLQDVLTTSWAYAQRIDRTAWCVPASLSGQPVREPGATSQSGPGRPTDLAAVPDDRADSAAFGSGHCRGRAFRSDHR